MKLIQSKVELIDQDPGLIGICKQIELAGRTCYKSESNITENSAKEFVDRMIKSKHNAMLEHGTVYLRIPIYTDNSYRIDEYKNNKYSNAVINMDGESCCYITTNMRVLVEHNWLDDLKYICEPAKFHEKRLTVRFTCDRGVSHEFVRHRVFSFAQESTRYCNYSKDKFGNEITFIEPSNKMQSGEKDLFIKTLEDIENTYIALVSSGLQPQQARAILPNALKTELIMTGTIEQWKSFFALRSPKYGAKGVHPDAAKLADELYEFIKDRL